MITTVAAQIPSSHAGIGDQYTSSSTFPRTKARSAHVSGPRWARSVTPTTMRCARASSPRSRPSSYSGRACEIRPRLGWPFSTSSRPGTIRTGDTRHSVSCRPSTTKGGTHPQLESLVHNCPLRGANSTHEPVVPQPQRQHRPRQQSNTIAFARVGKGRRARHQEDDGELCVGVHFSERPVGGCAF